jgi:hypothetical protein
MYLISYIVFINIASFVNYFILNNNLFLLIKRRNFLAIISLCFIPNNKDIYYLVLGVVLFEIQNREDELIQKHINYIFAHMAKSEKNEGKIAFTVKLQ